MFLVKLGGRPPPQHPASYTYENKQTSQPTTSAPSPSKFVPRSLSVVEMLKLGKRIQNTTTPIKICSFDFDTMCWSSMPNVVDFTIEEEPFGVGGFCKALNLNPCERIS